MKKTKQKLDNRNALYCGHRNKNSLTNSEMLKIILDSFALD